MNDQSRSRSRAAQQAVVATASLRGRSRGRAAVVLPCDAGAVVPVQLPADDTSPMFHLRGSGKVEMQGRDCDESVT